MAKTDTQLLEAVQDAIYNIATQGQSVRFENRTVTQADLDELYKLEKYYALRVAKDTRGGIRIRGGTPV